MFIVSNVLLKSSRISTPLSLIKSNISHHILYYIIHINVLNRFSDANLAEMEAMIMGDSGGTSHSNSMQSYSSPSSTSLLAQAVAPSGAVLAIMFTIWWKL